MSVIEHMSDGQDAFRELIGKCIDNRQALKESGHFSLPSELGKLVIIVSGAEGSSKDSHVSPDVEYGLFLDEAERLKEERSRLSVHQDIVIRPEAIVDEIERDFVDPEVSDITFIGHGSIARIWTDDANKHFGWSKVAKSTAYLKQGVVEQRMCGHFPNLETAVPLGTFAVRHLSSVRAATGIILPDIIPPEYDSHLSHLLKPVFDDSDEDNLLARIDALNEQYRGKPVRLTLEQLAEIGSSGSGPIASS